jgi:uracil-DNA glycosylase
MLAAKPQLLQLHVSRLLECQACPAMHKPVVTGGAVVSKVVLVGQAPGDKEPVLGRPFAWTAGKTLFGWFEEFCGLSETEFRSSIYMAAVCRCFPGKKATGGDRVPDIEEIRNCSRWLDEEIRILNPELIIPVGKLAIQQFLAVERLDEAVGKKFEVSYLGYACDLVPLPHPSGASPWHRMEPGRTLLRRAMRMICQHPALAGARANVKARMTN